MSKPKGDAAPRITIHIPDAPPEPNTTLLDMLRDGERPKPGEPGTLANRLGREVQDFLAHQHRVAGHRRTAVKGKLVLDVAVTTGPDGSHQYSVSVKKTEAKIPAATSMTFTDEDGELLSRPAEPLTEEMYRREKQKAATPDPKAGASSKL